MNEMKKILKKFKRAVFNCFKDEILAFMEPPSQPSRLIDRATFSPISYKSTFKIYKEVNTAIVNLMIQEQKIRLIREIPSDVIDVTEFDSTSDFRQFELEVLVLQKKPY